MRSLTDALAQANNRLKAGKIGVKIQQIGDRLYLRATLPAKPDSQIPYPHQQRIALGLYANFDGINQAEAEALKLGALLACREFTWEHYLKNSTISKPVSAPASAKEWIEQFEIEYFIRRKRDAKSETTWQGDYLKVFNKLPQHQVLTVEMMRQAIVATEPDSRTRKRTCMVLGALAKFAGIQLDTKSLAGQYSARRASPREIPDDKFIVEWFYKIKNPAWRWVYGLLATYGLRPHEAFRLDFDRLRQKNHVVYVKEGKTGARRVWPCYPEWVEQFDLFNVQIPNINTNRSNSSVGSSCGKYFRLTAKLPFLLYDLRHAWAIRTLEFGLDVTLASQQMGHSVQVHTSVYHHWIDERHHQKAFELFMMRTDRPQPPQK